MRKFAVVLSCAIAVVGWNVFGLGMDHPNGQPVNNPGSWPEGMTNLVNRTNRIHGYFVNFSDAFFFVGNATNFSSFLEDYSRIGGTVDRHRLILHDGVGEAKSPWDKTGKPCDWELYACPKAWLIAGKMSRTGTNSPSAIQQAAKDTNFVSEVHFWMGGKISLDRVAIPRNVEFAGDYLQVFESITNGMTRAEVEKEFRLDGGLQSMSPVRFLHPSCPMFKVNVEFDIKRDAADQNRAITGKDDKVIRVSKPYLQGPFSD